MRIILCGLACLIAACGQTTNVARSPSSGLIPQGQITDPVKDCLEFSTHVTSSVTMDAPKIDLQWTVKNKCSIRVETTDSRYFEGRVLASLMAWLKPMNASAEKTFLAFKSDIDPTDNKIRYLFIETTVLDPDFDGNDPLGLDPGQEYSKTTWINTPSDPLCPSCFSPYLKAGKWQIQWQLGKIVDDRANSYGVEPFQTASSSITVDRGQATYAYPKLKVDLQTPGTPNEYAIQVRNWEKFAENGAELFQPLPGGKPCGSGIESRTRVVLRNGVTGAQIASYCGFTDPQLLGGFLRSISSIHQKVFISLYDLALNVRYDSEPVVLPQNP